MLSSLPALIGDVFSCFSLPGGGVAGEALKALFRKRIDDAQEIMLTAISRGDIRFSETDAEESVAIVYRYLRAAQEGAARVNLRLLAQVFCGQARLGLIKADEFLYYADVLTPLRRDEILLLGSILRYWNEAIEEEPIQRMRSATVRSQEALIPKVFDDHAEFRAVADGMRRTGFFSTQATAGGGDLLGPSPVLMRLARLTDFEAVVG
ncbi:MULTISPECIES: hypothetical protein [Pandoraea]|uniref:hypothetical protein n=1 Tax=Pandoraea TaxID=93217 RepID=UPI001F5CF121|nr:MULTISPECIES: hypothetical protein [Pandoraea]MCI3206358.1 hypothetical protein [Pandoraea sp. LA3]MDN4584386.1 hypothetical protein [Pandoraea capi]